ncbi:hypothetical protein ACTXT7_015603 [Hymenolepis weldensis]
MGFLRALVRGCGRRRLSAGLEKLGQVIMCHLCLSTLRSSSSSTIGPCKRSPLTHHRSTYPPIHPPRATKSQLFPPPNLLVLCLLLEIHTVHIII